MRNNIIVLKVGTKAIMTKGGNIRKKLLEDIARDVKEAIGLGQKVVIVSSGAIGLGKKSKFLAGKELTNQVYSMVGQDQMVREWRIAFNKVGLEVGGALYVNKDLEKKRKGHIIKSLNECLDCGLVPVINENDAITTDEIKDLCGFGDNDRLASLIAIAVKASHLVLLTTVSGVEDPISGKIIPVIKAKERKIQRGLKVRAGDSNGSMISKLKNAKLTARRGVLATIASYKQKGVIAGLLRGERMGTLVVK